VSCRTGGDGPNKIAGLDRVYRCATNPGLAVFGEPAGAHTAQLATHPSPTNIAGRHLIGPVKSGANTQFVGPNQHLLGCRIN
jgi:hypothetical protein